MPRHIKSPQEQRDDLIRRMVGSTQKLLGNCERREAIDFLTELSSTERQVILKLTYKRRLLDNKKRKAKQECRRPPFTKPTLEPYARPH